MSSLWKPVSESDRRAVFLAPSNLTGRISTAQLIGPQGNVLEQGRFAGIHNGNRSHFRFNNPGGQYPSGSRIVVNFDNGGGYEYNIGSPGRRYDNPAMAEFQGRYSFDGNRQFGSGGQVSVANGGPAGGISGGAAAGGIAPPFYLDRGFPQFPTVSFPGVDQADFNRTDPMDFAARFGAFQSSQLGSTFEQAREFSLEALNTELQGLRGFAPAAAALSRQQTRLDNLQNQETRTEQVDSVMPHARGTLAAQRDRARAYSEGRIPDAMQDRALELGLRSGAADRSAYSGFGERSMQANKISDLMNVESRLQLAQFGEQLTGSNLAQEADMFLAPTVYSDTGRQIRVTPEVSASRLSYEGFGAINQASLLSPSQGLSAEMQQEQFATQLEQRVNELNADGKFKASTFNAQGQFQSLVGQFSYDAQYLSAMQAAQQAQINNLMAFELQGLANEAAADASQGVQNAASIAGVGNIISGISSAIGGTTTPTSDVPTGESVGASTAPAPAPAPTTGQDASISEPASKTLRTYGQAPDITVPQGTRMAPNAPVPLGFSRVNTNPDGSFTVVPNAGYQSDLERFGRFQSTTDGPPVQVANAALADQAISNAANLSYVPLPGFQQVGSTASGKSVYSLPQAANDGNAAAGYESLLNSAAIMSELGITDPDIMSEMSQVASTSMSDLTPERLNELASSFSTDTPAGQQANFGLNRVADLWDNLSPGQRSSAIAALTPAIVEAKTGKNISEQPIPGTQSSVAGELKLGAVTDLMGKGLNGMAVARNWGQLSAIGSMLGKNTPEEIARIADYSGLMGFGPQGAAVNIDAQTLDNLGAQPVPEIGVGAVMFSNPGLVPKDYKIVSQAPDGSPIAMPTNLTATSILGNNTPSPLAFKKAQTIANGQHPAQKLWGESPTGRGAKGAAGGSAIVSGMNAMLKNNPSMAGSVTAYSLFRNSYV